MAYEALSCALSPHWQLAAVLPINWPKLLRASGAGVVPTLLTPHLHRGRAAVRVEKGAATALKTGAPAAVSLETVLALVARTAGGAVDADVPLMEAGLDSLGAVELRNELQEALGEGAPALPSTLAFDHPTARQLAVFLAHGASSSTALLPLLEPLASGVRAGEAYPVSWNQSQLLTVHAGGGGAEAAYNISLALWLRGPLAVGALRAALDALVARHAVLRTTFEVDAEGGFVQRVRTAGGGGEGSDGAGGALLREAEAPSAAAAEAVASTKGALGFELLGAGAA
eukprot:scaffold19941_cov71-Phaeocystis_antarctica.AAC.1